MTIRKVYHHHHRIDRSRRAKVYIPYIKTIKNWKQDYSYLDFRSENVYKTSFSLEDKIK